MSVIRVNKTQNYTVMSNHHLRDDRLSLKAIGLMSWMLSLPDNWDYSIAGIAKCRKVGKDTIRSTLKELEEAGYLTRDTKRDENGRFTTEFILREYPVDNDTNNRGGKSDTVNPTQISTKKTSTKKQKTNCKKEKENKNVDENGFSPKNSSSPDNSTKSMDIGILRKQVRKICREDPAIEDTSNIDSACYTIIAYYLEKYKEFMGKDHPIISNRAMRNIILSLYNGTDDDRETVPPLGMFQGLENVFSDFSYEDAYGETVGTYKEMIDQHFLTHYGADVDYGISHFMTDGIRKNRYLEVAL